MTNETSLDNVDINIDSIDDMPGFDTPPSGEYLCNLSLVIKELGGKPVLAFVFTLGEQISEGTQHTEKPKLPGQKFDILFNLDEKGLPWVKPHLKMLQSATGSSPALTEIVGNSQGVNVSATFNYRSYTSGTGEAKEAYQLKALRMA